MTGPREYDLIVIGGGMAGLPMAIRSARAGLETALVERDLLGGTCLNRGCIPTKTMLRSAEVAELVRRSEEFGIDDRTCTTVERLADAGGGSGFRPWRTARRRPSMPRTC